MLRNRVLGVRGGRLSNNPIQNGPPMRPLESSTSDGWLVAGGAPGSRSMVALRAILVALIAAHLFQIVSPLRLDLDAIGYLSRTVEIVDGQRFGPVWLPPGYSLALAALEKVGLGNAQAFAALNLAFCLVGVAACYIVFRREFKLPGEVSLLLVCMTLLSFLFTKYLPIPVADTVFFGLSMSALAMLTYVRSVSRRSLCMLAAFVVLAIAATATRTIGIALAAPLAWTLWFAFGAEAGTVVRNAFGRPRLALILVVLLVGAASTLVVATSDYASQTVRLYAEVGLWERFSRIGRARLRSLGELSFNVPWSVAPAVLRSLYVPAAIAGVSLVGLGCFLRRHRFGAAESYFAAVVAVLMVYPGRQTRYWLPVLPLMLGLSAVAARRLMTRAIWRPIFVLYLVGYGLVGVGALVYSTSITTSGSEFARSYGDGTWSSAYVKASDPAYHEDGSFESPMHRRAFILLRRYDSRLAPADSAGIGHPRN